MHIQINENTLTLTIGDITKQHTDAIVNAANGSLLGGGGVDGAIHRAAGPKLLQACKEIRANQLQGHPLPTGEAVMTKGYHLKATYVIHTVGPIWGEDEEEKQKNQLANCYENSLAIAKEQQFTSIAFPSISTGVYRFPIDLASTIALRTILQFLEKHYFGRVIMTLFSERDYHVYENRLLHFMQEDK